MKKISIIIPAYNEENTILEVLERVSEVNLGLIKEIVIVDDGSIDNSVKVTRKFIRQKRRNNKSIFKLITKKNGGKGSAIKKGLEVATGEIITIQDADLEYDPHDYTSLIKPILNNQAKVVFGSRFLIKHKPKYKLYFFGNKFLSFLTKMLYGSIITDMETCYKVFSRRLISSLRLNANGFDIEPEITAKLLKKGIKIKEVPISYYPRSKLAGKKINWKDGIKAIWTLFYWRFKKF